MEFKNQKYFRIISIILSPISILSVLFIIMMFTFGNMFTLSFYVTNETEEQIQITPFGDYKSNEIYLKLPLDYWFYPSLLPRIKQANINIAPKQTKKFNYDADNVYLKGFVIKTTNLNKILFVDIEDSTYSINNLFELEDINNDLNIAITGETYQFIFYLLLLLGWLNIYALIKFRILRINRTQQTV